MDLIFLTGIILAVFNFDIEISFPLTSIINIFLIWQRGLSLNKLSYKILFPILIILIIGLLNVFNSTLVPKAILRDILILLINLNIIILANIISKDFTSIRKSIILIIKAISIVSLTKIISPIINILFTEELTLGFGNQIFVGTALVPAFIIYLNYIDKDILFFKSNYIFYNLISLLNIVLSLSRFSLISLFISVIFIRWGRKINKIKISLFLLLSSSQIFILFSDKNSSNMDIFDKARYYSELQLFFAKLINSTNEIFSGSFYDRTDIFANFRAYEAAQAITQFSLFDPLQKLIGSGHGSLVNLNIIFTVGDYLYNKVPLIHNIYPLLLIKYGFVGLSTYLFLIFILIFPKRYLFNKINNNYDYSILSIIGLIILISGFISSGLFNYKSNTLCLFIYVLIANTFENKKTIYNKQRRLV